MNTATGQEAHLVAEDLGFAFPGGVRALEQVDLRLHAGEFVSVVGPSGCGKSTLLRLVAGLLPGVEGTLLVQGRESPIP